MLAARAGTIDKTSDALPLLPSGRVLAELRCKLTTEGGAPLIGFWLVGPHLLHRRPIARSHASDSALTRREVR